jgi:hypothetical protein
MPSVTLKDVRVESICIHQYVTYGGFPMFSPTPWHYEHSGTCEKTNESFGNIIGAIGWMVAERIYEKDARPLIAVVNDEAKK